MNRKLFFFTPLKVVFVAFFLCPHISAAQSSLTQFVNPFIGTGGHGHTFPGATIPFGMIQLSPDTRIDDSWDGCGGYHYSDSVIYGFTHTHLSGTGVSDYGDILLMPTLGEPVLTPMKNGNFKDGYASHFSHAQEAAAPGYYAVHLDDNNIDVELTTASRVGMHKYTFPKSEQSNIILDLAHRDEVIESSVTIIDGRHVQGMRRSRGWAANQVVYFAIEFSKQFNTYGISVNGVMAPAEQLSNSNEQAGKNIQAFFQFNTSNGEAILAKVALSAVSMEGARNNLERELPTWDFEEVHINADATWNYRLNKIEVKGGTATQKKIFYTALYHCMIAPNAYNDVDKNYRGRDGQVHNTRSTYYTVFSLWDTYRALHPLLTILAPKETGDFIQTMLLQFEQGGSLPVWELSSNETNCMIGYHAVSVIADAAAKGIKGFDYKKALDAMKASAGSNKFGLSSYRENGCISVSDEGESVSKTLEYAYDDWCIAQMALKMNDTATYKTFIQRAQFWKNLFDPETGFMRPKKNGNFISPFDPYEVNFNYTEANAWQYRFAVQQDIEGLKKMSGGAQKMEAALDSLFSTTSKTSGREQSDISGLIGQYAHGNEPSHHMAYLYDYTGNPGKTQSLISEIINNMYHDSPDGLIGNEDCGQMSAWYV
ncbi:MAG: GH92 family glycosyl hydrolase, partial [Chitinophagales bacterium]